MSARTLQLAHITPSCDAWRGYGAREILAETAGRPPLWSSLLHAWTIGPWRSPDAVALAEARGYFVEPVDEAHLLRLAGHEAGKVKAAYAEARGELW